jgi:hypothetical protein
VLERIFKPYRYLSIDQEMISNRNMIDAHVQDFAANSELLLLMLKAFAKCTFTVNTARYRCFHPVVPTSSSLVFPRTEPDTPTPDGVHSWSMVCR